MIFDNDPIRADAYLGPGPFAGLLSLSEFATLHKVDDSTIRQAIRTGRLKIGEDCLKFGKQWVLSSAAIEHFSSIAKISEANVECRQILMARNNSR